MNVILSGSQGNLGKQIQKIADFKIDSITRSNWESYLKKPITSIDAFIHCAYDLKNKITDEPDLVLESNIISTTKALKFCKSNNINKFIFISSCSVYGHSSRSNEGIECKPVTINGLVKYLNEKIISEFCQENDISFIILRAFNSFGGEDQFSVISKLISARQNQESFKLYNKGFAERDFIHVKDIAQIVCHYVKNNSKYSVLNVGTGCSHQIKDVVEAFERKHGKITINNYQNKNEVEYSRADITKLESEVQLNFIDVFDFINNIDL